MIILASINVVNRRLSVYLLLQAFEVLLCYCIVRALRGIHSVFPVLTIELHGRWIIATTRVAYGEDGFTEVLLSDFQLIHSHCMRPTLFGIFESEDRNVKYSIMVDEVGCFRLSAYT